MLYVDERFANYVPLLELVALEADQVIIRDNKKDKIADVRAKKADEASSTSTATWTARTTVPTPPSRLRSPGD